MELALTFLGNSGERVLDVACGSGDAQTIAVTDVGNVYSWGDGDYGKLGRGGSDGSKVPRLVDKLQVSYIGIGDGCTPPPDTHKQF